MIATLIAAAAVVLLILACLLFYLPAVLRAGLLSRFAVFGVMALVIFGVGRFISGAVLRELGNPALPGPSSQDRSRSNMRFVMLLVAAVAVELLLIQVFGSSVGKSMIFDLAFYLVFFGCGVLVARDRAREFAPLVFGLIVILAVAAVQSVMFLRNPSLASRFGPDRYLVALRNFLIWAESVPLVMAITWAAWRVSTVNRLRLTQARPTQPTLGRSK